MIKDYSEIKCDWLKRRQGTKCIRLIKLRRVTGQVLQVNANPRKLIKGKERTIKLRMKPEI